MSSSRDCEVFNSLKREGKMAENFRILVHRTHESVHFKLLGDFDGSSADRLFCAIKKDITRTKRIFVHTNSLTSVNPSDAATFQKSLAAFSADVGRLLFTGEKGAELAPYRSKYL
jgi:hypothetical protein